MRRNLENGYSSKELDEFRELILEKLEAAKEELVYIKGSLDKTEIDEVRQSVKLFEESSEECEKENLSKLATRQNEFISKLEQALIRIQNGTYGVCMVSGDLISKARLKAVPHTTLSIGVKKRRSF